jgi:uncharacterized OB-fold protein
LLQAIIVFFAEALDRVSPVRRVGGTHMSETELPERPLPALEPMTEFYWTSGADGQLRIARCQSCRHYIHPPVPFCAACGSLEVAEEAVSGKGRIATYTVNEQQWVPGLEVPYVIAAVELAEQAELYVFANVVGCPADAVRSGMPVEVLFEQHGEIFIPLFQLEGGVHG